MRSTSLALVAALALVGTAPCQSPALTVAPGDLWGVWIPQRDLPPPPEEPPACPKCWLHAGALVWGVKDGPLPEPLLIARTRPPLVNPLLGRDEVPFGAFVGAQALAGMPVSDDDRVSVEVAVLVLEKRSRPNSASSDENGFPQLYRPIIDARDGQPATFDVSVPAVLSGRLDLVASSQMWGAEAWARYACTAWGGCRLDALAGFRHLGLKEGLDIVQRTQSLGVPPAPPIQAGAFGLLSGAPRFRVVDRFRCQNCFYGPEVGFRAELLAAPCWVALLGKFGLGVADQELRISGETTYTQGGNGTSFPAPGGRAAGGLLALPSNIGEHRRARLACLAEGGLESGIQVCSGFDFLLGYTFLYWGGVIRPGDQIDRRVNLAAVPLSPSYQPAASSPALPAVLFREREFWAHGLTASLRFVF